MNALWRLNLDRWRVWFGLIIGLTCLACQHAAAQDPTVKAKIFLNVKGRPALAHQPQVPRLEPGLRPSVSPPAPLPLHLNVLQYLGEKQGRVPVYSGMDGKLQLEFGLFGYLGIKYLF